LHKAQKHDWVAASADLVGFEQLHHLVVVPTCGENDEILADTLHYLTLQDVPLERVSVVLAFEERDPEAPIHLHIAEQRAEVEASVAHTGQRPVEWLLDHVPLSARGCLVHATHVNAGETASLAATGATVGLCPTTEANLGDGFCPVERLCERGIGICIGSDSNVRIDPLEELRELEGIARRRTGRRNVISVDSLLCFGSDEGAASLGVDNPGEVSVDPAHESLRGIVPSDAFAALVFGCSADVLD